MEINRFWILLGILVAILIPWYFMKYQKFSGMVDQARCSVDFSLIKVASDVQKLSVCSVDEFDRLLSLLERHISDLKFVRLLPSLEQYKMYKKLLKDYVVVPYVVSEILKEKKIAEDTSFIKDKELYLRIMENNFNINAFRDHVAKDIAVTDEMAKDYYTKHQKKKFNVEPFVKEVGGISAQIIPVTDEKKALPEYEMLFKTAKDIFSIDGLFIDDNHVEISQELRGALGSMKLGEVRIILIEGKKFAIKKTADRPGIWNDFDVVGERVKQILKNDLIDEKMHQIIVAFEEKLKIEICDKGLTAYLKNKSIDGLDSVEKLESNEDEKIDEKDIKTVMQQPVEIV